MKFRLIRTSSFIVYFLNFIGFSAFIAFVMAMGFTEDSRVYTIPLRLTEIFFIIFLFIVNKYRPSADKGIYIMLLWFFLFYFFKIFLDMKRGTQGLHIPISEFYLYSIVYCILPFMFFSQRKSIEDYRLMFRAIYISGILFSVGSILIFVKATITHGHYDRFKSVFDPLTFSYTGALLIGICLMQLIFNKTDFIKKSSLMVGIFFGIMPFLIGGSRGPILALILPLLFVLFYTRKIRVKPKHLIYSLIGIILFTVAISIFGDLSFKRLFNIFHDLATGSGEVVRLDIWKGSFNQFLDSPVWGDSVQRKGGSYPHNLIIEVLMSTGIIGFVPYFTLLIFGITRSVKIIKRDPSKSWIFLFFTLTFLMGMFSGNIVTDIWFWSSLALVFSVDLETNTEGDTVPYLIN